MPCSGQARTSGLEPGPCQSRRVQGTFVFLFFFFFRKSLMAGKRLDWRSRKGVEPTLWGRITQEGSWDWVTHRIWSVGSLEPLKFLGGEVVSGVTPELK